jgi:hypothetical protein
MVDIAKMEFFEEETEIYNSKMRLLMWLYDELQLNPKLKEELNSKGQELPVNV